MPGHVAALLPLLAAAACTAQLILQQNLSGDSLLDAFDFDLGSESSSASVFVNWSLLEPPMPLFDAQTGALNLAVDDSPVPFQDKRRSFSITSKEAWGMGSLIVLNVTNLPQGCTLAPTFRTHAKPERPLTGGSITVFKRRNTQADATTTLSHMDGNCILSSASVAGRMEGSLVPNTLNCTGSEECAISFPEPSNDRPMAGVWALNMAESAISVWFYPLKSQETPTAFFNDTIDETAQLGVPIARFAFDDPECSLRDLVEPQYLTVSLPICDSYSDAPGQFGDPPSPCSGSCYVDWAVGSPGAYQGTYISIASLRVYTNATFESNTSSAPPPPSPTGGPSWTAPAPLVEPPRHVLPVVAAGSFVGMLLGIASWFAGSRLPVTVRPPRLRRRRRPVQ